MSKSGVKVETDQLKACAEKYKNLAEQYKSDWNIIENKLNECKTYWQGSFASDIDEVLNNVKKTREKIYENTMKLSSFINEAALLYEKYDGDIARALRDNSSLNSSDYPDNVKASVHVKTKQELDDLYERATKRANGMQHNDNGSISCAAMAKSKAIENGFDADWYGNGNQVYDNITPGQHSNYFATKYSGGDCLYDLINDKGQPVTDIVVSFQNEAGGGSKYGHVIYIDQIVDGKVYYSDNWVSSYDGTDTRKGMVCTLEEFISRYQRYNKCKPKGCVHLKKT